MQKLKAICSIIVKNRAEAERLQLCSKAECHHSGNSVEDGLGQGEAAI